MASQSSTIANPFHLGADVGPRPLVDRLAARARPDLAALALESLLAHGDPLHMSPMVIEDLLDGYGVRNEEAADVRATLWRHAVSTFLRLGIWATGGRSYAEALRGPLNIGEDDEIAAIHSLVLPRFADLVERSLAPENILDFRFDQTVSMAAGWGLDRPEVVKLIATKLVAAFDREVAANSTQRSDRATIIPRRMTRDEVQRVRDVGALHEGLIDIELKERLTNESRWLDLVENFVLDPIEVPIHLGKGEICVHVCAAELRNTVRDKFQSVGAGTWYLTNKRMVFNAPAKAVITKYESILEIELLLDGVKVKLTTGKPLIFVMKPNNAFLAGGILNVMLRAHQKGYVDEIVRAPTAAPQTQAIKVVSSAVEKSADQAPNQGESTSTILERAQHELDALVGLAPVKREVATLTNLVRIRSLRKAQGLPLASMSFHLVFTGNPGTGKTTVARVIAEVFAGLGMLSKGHLVETDRSGMVGGYVGQTALKTADIVRSALGGVLFIDEAYSLAGDHGQSDYGQEAIETLLKMMEDHREDLIVIAAGYGNLMQTFLASNPGIRSRFSRTIEFPDYTSDELVEVVQRMATSSGYVLAPAAVAKLAEVFTVARETAGGSFGNARVARNLFERALSRQADRLATSSSPSRDDLCSLTGEDVPEMSDLE